MGPWSEGQVEVALAVSKGEMQPALDACVLSAHCLSPASVSYDSSVCWQSRQTIGKKKPQPIICTFALSDHRAHYFQIGRH